MVSQVRGLAQVNLAVDDVAGARDWYARALGVEPYFQRPDEANPEYVEFRLGDDEDELGLIARKHLPGASAAPGGTLARWHVDDLPAMVDRLKGLGARENEPIVEREAGFSTASVIDPFGNVLGLIHSPHWLENRQNG